MTPTDFTLHIVMIASIFIVRGKIADFISEKIGTAFKPQWISYLLAFWLTIVVIFGMLFNTKKPFGTLSVSQSMENLEPSENKKPHRYFDINFNVFNF